MAKKQRLLLVDDDVDLTDSLKVILEGHDYEVDVANDAEAAVHQLQKTPPDLVLLDVMMGKRAEGIILSRKIKRDPDLPRTPVIILTGMRKQTGFYFMGEPKHPTFLPVEEVLEKPVDHDKLLAKIAEVLARCAASAK